MLFEIGNYTLDIDVERTRDFYLHAQPITDGCDCQGCRNYIVWANSLNAEPKYILESMGVQLEKTPEVFVNCRNEDNTLCYGGFYHLCGTILQGKEPWIPMGENGYASDESEFVPLADHYYVVFSKHAELLEEGFPTPVIQMEIYANIPFVLPEKCAYEIMR